MIKKIACTSLLLINISLQSVTPYYSIRSQSENTARELVGAGWNNHINLCDTCNFYGNFSVTPEYTRSFRPLKIGECLFGKCGNACCSQDSSFQTQRVACCATVCNTFGVPTCENVCCPYDQACLGDDFTTITISGSQVAERGMHDWLADYFGLPTDYRSCVSFDPHISNFLIDMNLYLGFDNFINGLYFRAHAPLVYTEWDLNMCEVPQDCGSNAYWPGYFSGTLTSTDVGIERNKLVNNFTSFINGCGVIKDNSIKFMPLCKAKMSCQKLTKTALSDIQMAVGWNFLCDPEYHAGINLRGAIPTGTRPEGCYLFEPIIGNGHHWEAGIGFSMHVMLWLSCDECKYWEFFLDANVTHLFKTKQCRTFDLCGKPLSRYMLAEKFSPDVTELIAANLDDEGEITDPMEPSHQFTGIYNPVANLTTMPVDVSVTAQADLVLMAQYVHGNWSIDFGYNFWGRTCENIHLHCDCYPPFVDNVWGLKGDAFTYGFQIDESGEMTDSAVALSATQSRATIHSGANNWPDGLTVDTDGGTTDFAWAQNPGVDNRHLAWDSTNTPLVIWDQLTSTTAQVNTSLNPILLTKGSLDINGARTQGLSHKFFGHIDYTWNADDQCACWYPYLGIGGEIEFADHSTNNCCNSCDDCNSCSMCGSPGAVMAEEPTACTVGCVTCSSPCDNPNCCAYCAVSQWGVWIKGGIGF